MLTDLIKTTHSLQEGWIEFKIPPWLTKIKLSLYHKNKVEFLSQN